MVICTIIKNKKIKFQGGRSLFLFKSSVTGVTFTKCDILGLKTLMVKLCEFIIVMPSMIHLFNVIMDNHC